MVGFVDYPFEEGLEGHVHVAEGFSFLVCCLPSVHCQFLVGLGDEYGWQDEAIADVGRVVPCVGREESKVIGGHHVACMANVGVVQYFDLAVGFIEAIGQVPKH